MTSLSIDVYSDPICPWCYIGQKRLAEAIETYPGDVKPALTWRCFQLNPSMPAEGMDRRAYLSAKFGGPEQAEDIYGNIYVVGQKAGIDFQFDAIGRTPNTLKAHRLLRYAQEHMEDATPLITAMFKAYFLLGQDIGDTDALLRTAMVTQLNQDDLATFLDSSQFEKEVLAEESQARSMGLSGVPFFVLGSKYAMSGAQEPQAFHRLFDTLLAE